VLGSIDDGYGVNLMSLSDFAVVDFFENLLNLVDPQTHYHYYWYYDMARRQYQ
jgi:hypothetical protein